MSKEKSIRSNQPQPQAEINDDFIDGSFEYMWMSPERDFRHQNEKYQFTSTNNSPLELGYVISTLFDIRKEELGILTINDGTVRDIRDSDEIWRYHILSMYKDADTAEKPYVNGANDLKNHVVLTLSYNTDESRRNNKEDNSRFKSYGMMIIHIQSAGGIKDKAIYAQVTFTLPTPRYARPFKAEPVQPEVFSILMAYYFDRGEKLTIQMENTINSALDKFKTGRVKEMTYQKNVSQMRSSILKMLLVHCKESGGKKG